LDSVENHKSADRFALLLKIGVTVFGAGYTILYFILSIPRLLFPYEIEWMEGSMLDQALRIFQGKSLFVIPSIHMVNWQYQPLYYYAVAAAMQLFGITFFAGRFVSFISILVSAILIFVLIRKETSSWWFAFLGPSFLFAAYGVTGYWYEIARVDTLMLAFLLISFALVVTRRKIYTLIFASFFLALAFFTKQQALMYAAPVIFWLFLSDKRSAIIYTASIILFVAAGILLFNFDSGGWYSYYTFTIPRSMGNSFHWDKIIMVLPEYLFTQYAAGTVLILFFLVNYRQSKIVLLKSVTGLYILLTLTAVAQLGIFLGHAGAYRNAAIPLAATMALFLPIISFHLMKSEASKATYFIHIVLCIQFVGLFYSFKNVPLVLITKNDYIAGRAFLNELQSIPGDVFFPQHGFFPLYAGKNTYANELAAEECHDVGDTTARRFWSEWEQAYIGKKYNAIIIDEGPFKPYDSIPGYTYVGEMNHGAHPFVTRITDATSIPRYLYLPKK
jgi:hypothetical protein